MTKRGRLIIKTGKGTMLVKHVEKRVRVGTTVKVTALCGAPASVKMWLAQDARDLLRLVREGKKPKHYGKSWKFCPDCEEKI